MRKHIEDKHPETFNCDKYPESFLSKNGLDSHKAQVHTDVPPHSQKICTKCEMEFENEADLKTHISDKHISSEWALLIGDSRVKSVKSRQIERKLKGNKLRNPAASSPREGSAYTTTRDWPNARFPDSNLTERIPELLSERAFGSLIVLTPSNNIKNIEHMDWEEQNKLSIKTSIDTVEVIEKALLQHDSLEKVVLVKLPPRADSTRLSELTEFANFSLRGCVEKSKYKDKTMPRQSVPNSWSYI